MPDPAVRPKRKYWIIGSEADLAWRARRRRPQAPSAADGAARTSSDSGGGCADDLDARARTMFSRSRHDLIAEAAYYRAAKRGFQGGDSDRDWYEAEKEIEALLRRGRPF